MTSRDNAIQAAGSVELDLEAAIANFSPAIGRRTGERVAGCDFRHFLRENGLRQEIQRFRSFRKSSNKASRKSNLPSSAFSINLHAPISPYPVVVTESRSQRERLIPATLALRLATWYCQIGFEIDDIAEHEESFYLPPYRRFDAPISSKCYRIPPKIISCAVWSHHRFPLGLRMIEEMLAAQSIELTCEAVGCRATKVGLVITKRIRSTAPDLDDKWHLTESALNNARKLMR